MAHLVQWNRSILLFARAQRPAQWLSHIFVCLCVQAGTRPVYPGQPLCQPDQYLGRAQPVVARLAGRKAQRRFRHNLWPVERCSRGNRLPVLRRHPAVGHGALPGQSGRTDLPGICRGVGRAGRQQRRVHLQRREWLLHLHLYAPGRVRLADSRHCRRRDPCRWR